MNYLDIRDNITGKALRLDSAWYSSNKKSFQDCDGKRPKHGQIVRLRFRNQSKNAVYVRNDIVGDYLSIAKVITWQGCKFLERRKSYLDNMIYQVSDLVVSKDQMYLVKTDKHWDEE